MFGSATGGKWAASNLSISLFVIGRFRVASRNRYPGEEIDTRLSIVERTSRTPRSYYRVAATSVS